MGFLRRIALMAVPVLLAVAPAAAPAAQPRWLASWGAAMVGAPGPAVAPSATHRQFAHLSAGGRAVRVRLSNRAGTVPLTFTAVTVAVRAGGAALQPGTLRRLTLRGSTTIVVPPGAEVSTDRVALRTRGQDDLAVSLYAPGSPPVTEHPTALTTEYATAAEAGDHTADPGAAAFTRTQISLDWVDGVDVLTRQTRGSIIALGDSITDGSAADRDGNDRWLDVLGRRLGALPAGDPRRRAVVNAGLARNTLCPTSLDRPRGRPRVDRNPLGPAILRRLRRDVYTRAGATDVILFAGSNDLRGGAPARSVIGCLNAAARRLHAHGLRVIGATVIPRDGGAGWTARVADPRRRRVNRWVRRTEAFDAVIDFDRVVRSRRHPGSIAPRFQSTGEADAGTHPNPAGHAAMGHAIPLDLFAPASGIAGRPHATLVPRPRLWRNW
jgi:lysophospholipase L1-like esterase